MNEAGVQPNTYILDNECSDELKKAFHKDSIGFQRVPPSCYCANMAERAILTFKSHFKAGMASLDPNYPIRKWYRLLPQTEMTLNLLRSALLNPKLSAHPFLFGQFDYNKTPIVPPSAKVVVHKKISDRGTWATNGDDGWSIGPSPEHYHCLKVVIPKTRAVRDTDTLKKNPTRYRSPKLLWTIFYGNQPLIPSHY